MDELKMEKLSFAEDREVSENNLDQKIQKAFAAALTNEVYNQKLEEFRSLCQQREGGDLGPDAEAKYQALRQQLGDCEIKVASIMEFRRLLELIPVPKQEIDKILSHENAHANVAEQVPSREFIYFAVRFYKDDIGKVHVIPSTYSKENASFPEEQRLKDWALVSEAPLLHDKKADLSARDLDNIKVARQRLKQARWEKQIDTLNKIEGWPPIDENIKETIAALNVSGVTTLASCGGHMLQERHTGDTPYPWILIASETQGKTSSHDLLQSLLAEFYKDRSTEADIRLVANDGGHGQISLASAINEELDSRLPEGGISEEERSDFAVKLPQRQQEMEEFGQFLKSRFFTKEPESEFSIVEQKDIRQEYLRDFIDYRNNYIDDIPAGQIAQNDPRLDLYKCRGHFFLRINTRLILLLKNNILKTEAIERCREFMTFVENLDADKFQTGEPVTKEDIDKANAFLDYIISELE